MKACTSKPQPFRQSLQDLKQLIQPRLQKDSHIILSIDENEQNQSPAHQILTFTRDLDSVNIIQHDLPAQVPNTHSQGDRINYILIPTSLVDSVIGSEIITLNHLIIYDHKSSFYDFDTFLYLEPLQSTIYPSILLAS